jgi:hypothetical protein
LRSSAPSCRCYKNGLKKKKQEIFTEDYNTVSNSNKNLRLEWLEWELMQKKPEGGNRMGYSAKEMDDDFTSRSVG